MIAKSVTLIAVAILALTVEAVSAAPCLPQNKNIRLSGVIVRTSNVPRNLESYEPGEDRGTAWLLRLDKPICIEGTYEPHSEFKEIQLVLGDKEMAGFSAKAGKRIIVVGQLGTAGTGHYWTEMQLWPAQH